MRHHGMAWIVLGVGCRPRRSGMASATCRRPVCPCRRPRRAPEAVPGELVQARRPACPCRRPRRAPCHMCPVRRPAFAARADVRVGAGRDVIRDVAYAAQPAPLGGPVPGAVRVGLRAADAAALPGHAMMCQYRLKSWHFWPARSSRAVSVPLIPARWASRRAPSRPAGRPACRS